ncbi:MAG: hypothetical protein IPM54_12850 [Polyangiaceae bacterium]|nr:hypothetical protein [Polyangiaceae bacterium]
MFEWFVLTHLPSSTKPSCAMAKRPGDRFSDLAAFAAAIAPFGGSDARTRAELVARALVTPNAHVDPEPSRTSRAPTDEAPRCRGICRDPRWRPTRP